MATQRKYLQCDVCGTVTMTRTQIGWLEVHPIRFHCGHCGILIPGTARTDQKNVTFQTEFENATEVETDHADFYIEVSGEFLTAKPQPITGAEQFQPPFFAGLAAMEFEGYERFKAQFLTFLSLIENEWPYVRRINELWQSRRLDYLTKELKRYFPLFDDATPLPCLQAVHYVNAWFIAPITTGFEFERNADAILAKIVEYVQGRGKALQALVQQFGPKRLDQYEAALFSVMAAVVSRFSFLIPVFGMRFSKNPEEYADGRGITTASIEDLRTLFTDSFEIGGDVIALLVAFNNLEHRGHHDQMAPKRKDVKTLADWEAKGKGDRVAFVDGGEEFDWLVGGQLDNRLRNALSHQSYSYDGVAQVLTYYPSGVTGDGDAVHMDIVEFADRTWRIALLLVVNLAELVFQTQKLWFMAQGMHPLDPAVVKKEGIMARGAGA